MIPSLGYLCLIVAACIAGVQAGVPLFFSKRDEAARWQLARKFMLAQTLLIASSFACLLWVFYVTDLSVGLVASHSNIDQPLIYKLAAAWGNHEGSVLLWALVMAAYGAVFALTAAKKAITSASLWLTTLCVQGAMNFGLMAYIAFTSNPFERLVPAAKHGATLNPILQDIGLAFHPPMLYIGYVGFSITFCLAVAGLWTKQIGRNWAKLVQPYVYMAWAFLTCGIGLGCWWAYRELGWGGWWFWDPVENVSLLPWLTGTALMHALVMVEKRQSALRWACLLAILTYTLSLLGTFIVRSGLMVSVHSFASDPARGIFILCYVALTCGAALYLFSSRTPKAETTATVPALVSRDSLITTHQIFFTAGAGTVLFAILYPLWLQLLNLPTVTVGAPYYEKTFVPMMIPVLFLSAIAPSLPWQQGNLKKLVSRSAMIAIIAAASAWAMALQIPMHPISTAIGVFLGVWMMLHSIAHYAKRLKQEQRLIKLLASRETGMTIAHFGMGLFVLAAALSTLGKQEFQTALQAGESRKLSSLEVNLTAEYAEKHPSYLARIGKVEVITPHASYYLTPELRYFTVRQMVTSESSIDSSWQGDVYAVLHEVAGNAKQVGVTIYLTPAVMWLWLSFILMAGGGFFMCIPMKRSEA